MNSIIDLNAAANVNYNNQGNYVIAFGNSLGNTTSNVLAYGNANITNQCNITTLTDAVRDVLIDLEFSNVGNVNLAYTGSCSVIGIQQVAPATWRVTGIRTTGQYTDAMANVKYQDLTGASNVTPEYSYVTTVNDQDGNTRTWTTTVDVIPFGFSYANSVTFNEDESANITNLGITDLSANIATYNVVFSMNTPAAGNLMLNSNSLSNTTVTVVGNLTQVNSVLAANIRYVPADDYVSNSSVAFTVTNVTTGNLATAGNIDLIIGNTHPDYSVPSQLSYGLHANATVGTTPYGNLRITDLAVNRSYNVRATMANVYAGNLWVGSTSYGNQVTLTGTRDAVNANLANLVIVPNGNIGSNTTIAYVQTQTTANIQQANVTLNVGWTPTTWHVNSGTERDTGTLTYTLANGFVQTGNVDFWRVQYRQSGNLVHFPDANAANISLMRETSEVKAGPTAVRLAGGRVFFGDFDTSTTNNAVSTVQFWMYPVQDLTNTLIAVFNTHNTGTFAPLPIWPTGSSADSALSLYAWQGELFLVPYPYTAVLENFVSPPIVRYYQRASLGIIPTGAWTHLAFQRNDGSNTANSLSCWVNGVPANNKFTIGTASDGYYGNSTGPYGANWAPNAFRQVVLGTRGPNINRARADATGSDLDVIIDSLSVSNVGLYTGNVAFTPPTMPELPAANITQIINGI